MEKIELKTIESITCQKLFYNTTGNFPHTLYKSIDRVKWINLTNSIRSNIIDIELVKLGEENEKDKFKDY